MLDYFLQCVLLVVVILFLVMLAQKLRIAYPILLVLGGLLLSLLPGLPVVKVKPELIFVIFLPPLLYEAAWYTSRKDLWRWRRVITSFASIIVIVTSFVIALVASYLLPGFSLALGFLLGGIVSPPDAVSASAVLKYVKVPKAVSALLEGESLLNDASSLIIFRFALVAVDTGRFVFHEAAINFVLVIAMGILTGIAVGAVFFAVHKYLPTTTNIDIVLTLVAPYIMYISAEHFHFSGVLAVVAGGLFLSSRSHLFLTHRSRLQAVNVWSTLGFVLNGLVFMLIGLTLPAVVEQMGGVSLSTAIGYGVLISLVLIVTRIISALGTSLFTTFISRWITTADSRPGWRGPLVVGWAGMRGVVSLAAALSIPLQTHDGNPFPERNLILFITFVVILITLVLQGLTLPLVIRWVNLREKGNRLASSDQHTLIRQKLATHSIRFLDDNHYKLLKTNEGLQQLRSRFEHDSSLVPSNDDGHVEYFRVYLQLLAHQRAVLQQLNRKAEIDDEVTREFQSMLDLEEEKLRIRFQEEETDGKVL